MTASKIVLNAASGVGGAGLDVEDVFSTYLYTGNSSTQTITNGIDLSGEGGLTWIKNRSASSTNHSIFDSESGATGGTRLRTNLTNGLQTFNGSAVFTTSSTGFALNNDASNDLNDSIYDYVSWTFRKAPKFFDVVTYTGNGSTSRSISHNLGSAPGSIFIKQTSGSGENWIVWHRSISNVSNGEIIYLNATDSESSMNGRFDGANLPTSTTFTIEQDNSVNASGASYVAYLFAHNNNDGDFGPDGDADIIKCGSYTGNGSATGPVINLGFEPQWIMFKDTSATGDWQIMDVMRGLVVDGDDEVLQPNINSAETTYTGGKVNITPTGFQLKGSGAVNTSGRNYIYMAIRRGPLAPPEAATDVFDVSVTDYSANQTIAANIDVTDTFMIGHQPTNNNSNGLFLFSRLTGNKRLRTDQAFSENAELGLSGFDTQNGVVAGSSDSGQSVWNASFPFIKYFMKRAPNYFDVVAYTGDGVAGRTVSHNLGVAPEMIILKGRNYTTDWAAYHASLGNTKYLIPNTTAAAGTSSLWWNNTSPTASEFTLGNSSRVNNTSSNTYIAYLFATLAGISKVGSVTHSGTTNVDCGFSSGARFILLKRTDAASDWYFWDTTRGIVSGNDPYLTLNGTNQPEITNTDYIDPLSSGFTITSSLTAGDYIFYAIA